MQINTSELTPNQLNYAVAVSEWGHKYSEYDLKLIANRQNYCRDWSLGGPIIERERIRLDPRESCWHAQHWNTEAESRYSSTPLIAAMRCYVASKLGDTVDIPDDLV